MSRYGTPPVDETEPYSSKRWTVGTSYIFLMPCAVALYDTRTSGDELRADIKKGLPQ